MKLADRVITVIRHKGIESDLKAWRVRQDVEPSEIRSKDWGI